MSCDKFRCGLVQTMSHTVHECPETTMLPDGGPQTLHFSDNDTVYCLERTSLKVITTRTESFCAVLWHACVSPEQRPSNVISPYLWFIFLRPRTIQTDGTFPHRTAGGGWSSEDTGETIFLIQRLSIALQGRNCGLLPQHYHHRVARP